LVRRLLVICALAAMAFAVMGVVQGEFSEAAAATNNLTLTAPPPSGCPLGSSYTVCNALAPGTNSQAILVAQLFTVTNTSAAAVTNIAITFAAVPGQSASFNAADFTGASLCGPTLAPNAGCFISVAFTPTAAGLRQAALTVKDTQGDSTTLNLAGTASDVKIVPPGLPAGCTPNNAFTFCDVLPGGISAALQFTVASNNFVTGVTISLAAVPGLSSEFNALDFTENSTCGASISPFATCTISIQFTPTVASIGLRSAELNLTDTQGDAVTILLAGYVASAGNTTSNLTLTPPATPLACAFGNPFGYCNTPTGGTSANQKFTLTNTSGSSVTGITIPFPVIPTPPALPVATDFTVESSQCTATLLAHTSCTISIAFTPTAIGQRQASITVSDAQGDLAMINLTGYGDDYQLQIAPGQPGQISIIPGATATFKGQVVSDGVFGLQGEQVEFVCPSNLPTLTTCAFSPCPVAITPGTPVAFSIIFVTSSNLVTALPPVAGPCPGNTSAILLYAPKGPTKAPNFAAAFAGRFLSRGLIFPALFSAVLLVIFSVMTCLGMRAPFAFGFAGTSRRRAACALGVVFFAAAVLAGCHHSSTTQVGTPTGTTTMVVQGQALDASGNPLNASRTMPEIILGVVKQ
jgi:hypothetical protein